MAANIYWSGSQSAVFAGPVPPTLPTAFWLNNGVLPHVLNYWLDAPQFTYLPLGTIDPSSAAFTPVNAGQGAAGSTGGAGGSSLVGGIDYISATTPPSDVGKVWIDLANGTISARPVMHFVESQWLQVGWYDPGAGRFASFAPGLDDVTVTPSLAAIANPQPGDEAWLTSAEPWTKQLFLNGVWTPTGEAFDSIGNRYLPAGSGLAPASEWQVASSLPLAGGSERVVWLESGSAPARQWQEHILLGNGWVASGRSYSEASGNFSIGASVTPVAATPALALFQQQLPRGTGGGDMIAGAWRDRALNRVQYNALTGVSLDSNSGEITVVASSPRRFLVEANAAAGFYFSPAARRHAHQLRLVNAAGSQLLIGHSHFDDNGFGGQQSGANDYALLSGVLSLAAGTHGLRLQHAFDFAPDGHSSELGHPVGYSMDLAGFTTLGGPEVFASLKLMEVA